MIEHERIRQAIIRNEFFLQYLPTISLQTGRCTGAEALIRWKDGDRIIPPLEFIPQIESTPLSGLLTYWVIETIGRELGDWLERTEHVHIGINVPPQLLGRGGLGYAVTNARLARVVDKLMLEISERGFVDQIGLQALDNVAATGALVALDDVRLSEVNLVALSRAKVHVVKLDKSVVDLVTDPQHSVRQTIATLTQLPELQIIAEGVETMEQAIILRDLGVPMAQGFYFSRPLRVVEFLRLFDDVTLNFMPRLSGSERGLSKPIL